MKIAEALVGCFLVERKNGRIQRYMITETEAYDGKDDLANHASKGLTDRTKIMFGRGGFYYIYLVYGLHWMLNIATGPAGYPAAILIRGIEVANGPAKLTKFLKINKSLNGKPVSPTSGLWIEPRKIIIKKKDIIRSARIGVNYAGPIWSKKEYRFSLATKQKTS